MDRTTTRLARGAGVEVLVGMDVSVGTGVCVAVAVHVGGGVRVCVAVGAGSDRPLPAIWQPSRVVSNTTDKKNLRVLFKNTVMNSL
jgi:hypothetical protein